MCVSGTGTTSFLLLFSFFPCPKRIHPQESRRKEGQTRQDSGVGNKNGETSLNGEKKQQTQM